MFGFYTSSKLAKIIKKISKNAFDNSFSFRRCNSKMKQYYFNFWAQLNEEFTLPGVKPINVLLHILLRNLFNGLSGSDQSSIIENASTSWISTLTILGLERICEINEQKGKFICDQMFAQTDRILCHFQTTQNNESYYQLVCKYPLVKKNHLIK